jgi:hypothetical protein
MPDLSHMSDAELMAIYQQGGGGGAAPSVAASSVTRAPTTPAKTSAYNTDLDRIQKERDEVAKYTGQSAALNQFMEMNRRQPTGGVGTGPEHGGVDALNPMHWPGMLARNLPAGLGYGGGVTRNPQLQSMEAITVPLQGQMRPTGSGATSDYEQRLYRAGVPSTNKLGNANQTVATNRAAIIREWQDSLDFKEQYLASRGTLNGADAAFRQYVAQNPYTVLTETKKGDTIAIPNENRKSWREALNPTAPATTAAPAAAAANRRLTPAEAQLLPRGTKFTGTDGVERTRH